MADLHWPSWPARAMATPASRFAVAGIAASQVLVEPDSGSPATTCTVRRDGSIERDWHKTGVGPVVSCHRPFEGWG